MARVFPARALIGAACALAISVSCFAQTPQVRISQIFTGGGSSVNFPRADYVELFNAGDTPVGLAGWSVQVAAATGIGWSVTALNGTVAPKQYFLVQIGASSTTGTVFTPDVGPGSGSLATNGGKVALVSATAAINGRPNCPFPLTIVDFVGYGNADQTLPCNSGVNAPSITSNQAVLRRCGGKADIGSAIETFQAGTPVPRNSSTPANATPEVTLTAGAPIRAYVTEKVILDATAAASTCAGTVAGVTADLTSIGGPASVTMTRFGSTNSWQSSLILGGFNPPPGRYLIPVTAQATRLSETAHATLELQVRPPNDECAFAAVMDPAGGPSEFVVVNDGAVADTACAGEGDRGVWFRFTTPPSAPSGGQLAISETSGQNVSLSIFSGSCGELATVVCTNNEQAQANVSAGVTYFVLVTREGAPPPATAPALSVQWSFTPAVPPPVNDACAGALVFDPALGSAFFGTNNNGATADIDAGACTPSTVGDRGVWYRFTSPATPTPVPGTVTITEESAQDVAIAVFSGSCAALTPVLCTADETAQVQTAPSTNYYVLIVRDPANQGDSKPLGVRMSFSVTPPPQPPQGPANDGVCSAQTLTAGVAAAGTTVNASANGDGPLFTCAAGTVGGGRAVWYRFTPPTTGQYRFSTCGSAADTELSLFRVSGCPGVVAFDPVLGACDQGACAGGVAAEMTVPNLLGGQIYHLRVSNPFGAPEGVHTVRVDAIITGACCVVGPGTCTTTNTGACAPGALYQGPGTTCSPNPCLTAGNDDCAGAIQLQLGVPVLGNTLTATSTASLSTAQCASFSVDGNDVFFTFTPSLSVLFEVTACGSSFNTVLSVHSACPPTGGNRLICSDDSVPPCGPGEPFSSRIPQVQLLAGTTYYIRLAGYQGDTGAYRIAVLGSGLCCRGSTCNSTLDTPAACFGSLSPDSGIGVQFASSGFGCNQTGIHSTPCCHADFNKINGVSVDDLFAYLAKWFENSPFCDVNGNGSGAPTIDDLFMFLNAYFVGCE